MSVIYYLVVCTGSLVHRSCIPPTQMPSKEVCDFVAKRYKRTAGDYYTDAECLTVHVPRKPKKVSHGAA